LFHRKWSVSAKNWPKLRISWSWHPYSRSGIHNGPVYKFLWVLKKSYFRWKSIGVSLRFYRKSSVAVKTGRNSVIHNCDPRIPDLFYIMVLHMGFYGFSKISDFRSKFVGVSLRFYRKFPVCGKIDRNSVFLGLDHHIPDRLYKMAPYSSFHWFWKISNFRSKSIGVSLGFPHKSQVCGKNWLKLYISWSWPPYSGSVIHNGPLSEFLLVFENFKFFLKIHRCQRTVLP
jgi:hypothetical protein